MTEPTLQVPPADPGNTLLAGVPAQLTVSEQQTAAGKMAVLTVRTPCTTLTVFLGREELANWATAMQRLADQMGGLTIVGGGALPDLSMTQVMAW